MNKIVLITGASAGMGKETAKFLAQKGYTVYGAARRAEKMKELESLGIHTMEMDVTNDESMITAVEKIIQKEGSIDILINNAGFGSHGALEDVPLNDARYQFEVNVFGAARLTQLILPNMRKNKSGKIINISSIGGKLAGPYGGWYYASKFALEGLSDSLRNEVKQFGIDVIIIEPGSVKSEWRDIAYDNLQKTSANAGSAYRKGATAFYEAVKKLDNKASDPSVIVAPNLQSHHFERAEDPLCRWAYGKNHTLHEKYFTR